MRKTGKLTTLALALSSLIVLTGCGAGSTEPEPFITEWRATEKGDIYCIVNEISSSYTTTDCNWKSLVASGTHTTNADEVMKGEERKTEKGDIYCLINDTSSGEVTDCNWESLW